MEGGQDTHTHTHHTHLRSEHDAKDNGATARHALDQLQTAHARGRAARRSLPRES